MISKTRCSPVTRRQCLMLNLAKTQRFSEEARKQAAHSRLHTLFLSLYSIICSYGYHVLQKQKKKDGLFVVRIITKYSFQGCRDCLQYAFTMQKISINLFLCLALISRFHNIPVGFVYQYCGTVTVFNRPRERLKQ